MSEQLVTVCDVCFRTPNGDSPDCVYFNPYGCGHDLCNEHTNLRTADGRKAECRVCFEAKKKAQNAIHPAQS